MAKKIRKNKNIKLFFLVLGLLFAIGILIFSNFISKTTTSTDTKAAVRNYCSSYQSARGCPKNLGCVPNGKWCKFVGGTSRSPANNQPTSTQSSGSQNTNTIKSFLSQLSNKGYTTCDMSTHGDNGIYERVYSKTPGLLINTIYCTNKTLNCYDLSYGKAIDPYKNISFDSDICTNKNSGKQQYCCSQGCWAYDTGGAIQGLSRKICVH